MNKTKIINHCQAIYEMEFISPAFLFGVENKKRSRNDSEPVPEIRVPSIRGQMRYWWRAAKSWNGTKEHLYVEEARLFGGPAKTMNNPGISAEQVEIASSAFSLRLIPPVAQIKPIKTETVPGKNNSKKQAIPAGTKFKIILSSWDSNSFDQSCAAFELAALLGGLGQRSRRGFGAFWIKSAAKSRTGATDNTKSNDTLSQDLSSLLKEITRLCNLIRNSNDRMYYDYDSRTSHIDNRHIPTGKYPIIENIKIGNKTFEAHAWSDAVATIHKASSDSVINENNSAAYTGLVRQGVKFNVPAHDNVEDFTNNILKNKTRNIRRNQNGIIVNAEYIGPMSNEERRELKKINTEFDGMYYNPNCVDVSTSRHSLGGVNPRMGSPVHVSLIRVADNLRIICTQMTPVHGSTYFRFDKSIIKNYVNKITE